ncbi:MAG TPA: ABC transporter permease [Gaiellaceae bacterium]|nr:ABC transporter permease [Gaiellaceae bacterium]
MSTPAASRDPAQRVFRVKPSRPFFSLDVRELLQYHELLYFLVWRDVKVRYKQTALGVLWAVIQPFAAMVIFSIIFGRLANIQSPYGVPYPLFVFTGLLPWQYFSSCLTSSAQSVSGNANLVTKVYFPRLIVPLAAIVSPLIDFMFAFIVLLGLFVFYSYPPHWHAVAIPVFLGMALLTAFGAGLWLSALNVRYRDIPYVMPFIVQIWFFLTPVIYPVTLVPPRFHWIIALNPMSGVIDGFRWAVLGRGLPHYGVYALSALMGLCFTVSGLWYFKRVERTFADVI